jgi:hypothetical protein
MYGLRDLTKRSVKEGVFIITTAGAKVYVTALPVHSFAAGVGMHQLDGLVSIRFLVSIVNSLSFMQVRWDRGRKYFIRGQSRVEVKVASLIC